MRFFTALLLLAAIFSTPADARPYRHYHHRHARHHHHVRHAYRHHHVTVTTPRAAVEPESPFGALFAPILRPQVVWSNNRGDVASSIARSAAAHGVPAQVALAVAKFESGFDAHKVGSSGERGAMQVLPQTARHVGIYGNLSGPAGVEAGMRYLKQALAVQGRYGMCAAISAYNHGIGRVYCSHYGRTIMALMQRQPQLREAGD